MTFLSNKAQCARKFENWKIETKFTCFSGADLKLIYHCFQFCVFYDIEFCFSISKFMAVLYSLYFPIIKVIYVRKETLPISQLPETDLPQNRNEAEITWMAFSE